MELFNLTPQAIAIANNLEITQKEKKQHEFKLVARQRKVPGHTLFCFNLRTGEIKVAPVDRATAIDFRTREPIHRDRIVIEPLCIYRQALNKKNFIKILVREGILSFKKTPGTNTQLK